uniref:Uncharacterized protein n=1 Tax=Noctiluca scintillans TaxID=2966 RepID=A0A7S1F2Q2_NOCSC
MAQAVLAERVRQRHASMPGRRSRSRRARREKENGSLKKEALVKSEVVEIEDDDVAIAPIKSEIKAEKHEKKVKDKCRAKKKDPPRRSRSRAKKRARSSSTSTSSPSTSPDPYSKFKPYTKVTLIKLQRKADLNGMCGTVVHPSCAVSPCPPGCLLVRLDTGREIAIKPPNLQPLAAFHRAPPPVTQEERLQQVLRQIKLNVDHMESSAIKDVDGVGVPAVITDNGDTVQGGVGHLL